MHCSGDTMEVLVSLGSIFNGACLPFEQAKSGVFGSQLEHKSFPNVSLLLGFRVTLVNEEEVL